MILKTIPTNSGSSLNLLFFSDRVVGVEGECLIYRICIGTNTFKEAQRIHSKLLDYPVVLSRQTRKAVLLTDWELEATITGYFPIPWVQRLSELAEGVIAGDIVLLPCDRLLLAKSF